MGSAPEPQDGAPKSGDGAAPIFNDDAGTSTECERSLAVGTLTISMSNCWVNQHVENQKATLRFPCAGGSARATFAGHPFTGTVSGDTVTLQDVEPFLFNACQWQSTETIGGNLASGTMSYGYTEKPLAACTDLPCTASGTLQVTAGAVTVVK
jgi:hypothetical protein